MNQEPQIPWYKNHILLLIIIIPFLTVCGAFYTLYLAVSSKQSGVLESYQKQGLSPMKFRYENSVKISGEITPGQLRLFAKPAVSEPLTLILEHATLAKLDRKVVLKAFSPNIYPISDALVKLLPEQKWYIRVRPEHDPKWQLEGQSDLRHQPGTPDKIILTLP